MPDAESDWARYQRLIAERNARIYHARVHEGKTYRACGEPYGLSATQVRRIIDAALWRLRHPSRCADVATLPDHEWALVTGSPGPGPFSERSLWDAERMIQHIVRSAGSPAHLAACLCHDEDRIHA